MDFLLYQRGYAFNAYTYFGAHVNENGTLFRTHAPEAKHVSIIGDFNDWQDWPMQNENGVWSVFLPEAKEGMKYKFRIYDKNNHAVDKADPYAFYSELRPLTASIIYDHNRYQFRDQEWMQMRSRDKNQAISIYEMHLGSWKTKVYQLGEEYDGERIQEVHDNWFTYREICSELVDYLKKMHYTHVEFLPLFEHPLDMSWGYQASGFFSPTARYGNPDELKYLIDTLHQNKIGVILDFIPVHFVTNDFALGKYDGTALYEYPYDDIAKSEWGSYNFNHGKGEVKSFLSSCANYWLDKFHIDGLRFDAISRLIYWEGDKSRGYIEEGISFMKGLNAGIHQFFPDVILIAEDSSDYPLVTKATEEGGLGFDYKWDMGFMHDTLDFFEQAPWMRHALYHKITFSMMYFYNEQFLLPFSHDEVVHLKKSMIDKLFGTYDEKFAQSRSLYLYMFAHPGKKLNFMGNDIARFREWDESREEDWNLLSFEKHEKHLYFFQTLNKLYQTRKDWHENDYDRSSFQWLVVEDHIGLVYAFWRGSGKKKTLFIFNWSGQAHPYYVIHFEGKILSELINSNWTEYGGYTPNFSHENNTWEEVETHRYALYLDAFSARAFEIEINSEEDETISDDCIEEESKENKNTKS